MSDIDDQMAEWRKTVWGTGPCPDSSQENFTLTDKEREAIREAIWGYSENDDDDECASIAATLRSLLERTK
jgi:hypothetical protein